jgi:type I restriction enzyme S subunit
MTKLRRLPVPLPPAAEQRRLVMEIQRHLSVEEELSQGSVASERRAKRLRQAILKWAFEGRLVDQDPGDEPASVLLERIRQERAHAGETAAKPGKARARKAR